MIRSYYGLTRDPFDLREFALLPAQQDVHDTLAVHSEQGGLCLVLGVPGTGKSVIKMSLQRLPESQHLVATVARTLHTYTNTVKILCEAFRVAFESSAFACERKLIEQAFALNHAGKCLTTVLDDAHLMDLANLRKLRLLFEDFPKNHNLVLVGRPSLLANLDLGVNQDIKSRVTYSVVLKRMNPDAMRAFLLREIDRAGLGHNTVTPPAVDLIVRPGGCQYPEAAYDEYAMRGESENRHKEFKCGLGMDRLSDHRFVANYFRLYLHAAAMTLRTRLRREVSDPPSSSSPDGVSAEALPEPERKLSRNARRRHDPLGEGQPATWRTMVIKVAAVVVVRCRRVVIRLSGSWPHRGLWERVAKHVANRPPVAHLWAG